MSSTTKPTVPDGMVDLLKGLTKEILREKPKNINVFAANYFEKLLIKRDGTLDKGYEQFRNTTNPEKFDYYRGRGSSGGAIKKRKHRKIDKNGRMDNGKKAVEKSQMENLSMKGIEVQGTGLRVKPKSEKPQKAAIKNNRRIQGIEKSLSVENVPKSHSEKPNLKNLITGKLKSKSIDEPKIELTKESGQNTKESRSEKIETSTKQKKHQRKLSSRKPSDNLIAITEEPSIDNGEESNEAKRNSAAIKIQVAFRAYQAFRVQKALTEAQSTKTITENLAAIKIQRIFKVFVEKRKLMFLKKNSMKPEEKENTIVCGQRTERDQTSDYQSADSLDGESTTKLRRSIRNENRKSKSEEKTYNLLIQGSPDVLVHDQNVLTTDHEEIDFSPDDSKKLNEIDSIKEIETKNYEDQSIDKPALLSEDIRATEELEREMKAFESFTVLSTDELLDANEFSTVTNETDRLDLPEITDKETVIEPDLDPSMSEENSFASTLESPQSQITVKDFRSISPTKSSLDQYDDRHTEAATKIQAHYRGYQTRKKIVSEKELDILPNKKIMQEKIKEFDQEISDSNEKTIQNKEHTEKVFIKENVMADITSKMEQTLDDTINKSEQFLKDETTAQFTKEDVHEYQFDLPKDIEVKDEKIVETLKLLRTNVEMDELSRVSVDGIKVNDSEIIKSIDKLSEENIDVEKNTEIKTETSELQSNIVYIELTKDTNVIDRETSITSSVLQGVSENSEFEMNRDNMEQPQTPDDLMEIEKGGKISKDISDESKDDELLAQKDVNLTNDNIVVQELLIKKTSDDSTERIIQMEQLPLNLIKERPEDSPKEDEPSKYIELKTGLGEETKDTSGEKITENTEQLSIKEQPIISTELQKMSIEENQRLETKVDNDEKSKTSINVGIETITKNRNNNKPDSIEDQQSLPTEIKPQEVCTAKKGSIEEVIDNPREKIIERGESVIHSADIIKESVVIIRELLKEQVHEDLPKSVEDIEMEKHNIDSVNVLNLNDNKMEVKKQSSDGNSDPEIKATRGELITKENNKREDKESEELKNDEMNADAKNENTTKDPAKENSTVAIKNDNKLTEEDQSSSLNNGVKETFDQPEMKENKHISNAENETENEESAIDDIGKETEINKYSNEPLMEDIPTDKDNDGNISETNNNENTIVVKAEVQRNLNDFITIENQADSTDSVHELKDSSTASNKINDRDTDVTCNNPVDMQNIKTPEVESNHEVELIEQEPCDEPPCIKKSAYTYSPRKDNDVKIEIDDARVDVIQNTSATDDILLPSDTTIATDTDRNDSSLIFSLKPYPTDSLQSSTTELPNSSDPTGSEQSEIDEETNVPADTDDVENFDLSSCGEDSLEAMYYSIRKNELMVDRMHRVASTHQKIESQQTDQKEVLKSVQFSGSISEGSDNLPTPSGTGSNETAYTMHKVSSAESLSDDVFENIETKLDNLVVETSELGEPQSTITDAESIQEQKLEVLTSEDHPDVDALKNTIRPFMRDKNTEKVEKNLDQSIIMSGSTIEIHDAQNIVKGYPSNSFTDNESLKSDNLTDSGLLQIKENEPSVQPDNKNITANNKMKENATDKENHKFSERLGSSLLGSRVASAEPISAELSEISLEEYPDSLENELPSEDSKENNTNKIEELQNINMHDNIRNGQEKEASKSEDNIWMSPFQFAMRQSQELLNKIHRSTDSTFDQEHRVEQKASKGESFTDLERHIQRNILTASISEADSDEPIKYQRLTKDDFNISTALDHHFPSTDSDSTIISAATKIQAGARGFITRRRLRRSSGGTTSTADRQSFGNAAIDKSLDDLVEQQEMISLDDAAAKIQKMYRLYCARKRFLARGLKKPTNKESMLGTINTIDDSVEDHHLGVTEVKFEQKNDDNRPKSDNNNIDSVNHSRNEPSEIPKKQQHLTDFLSVNFDELDTAHRRMTLQRGDAVQRNSTPDDMETINVNSPRDDGLIDSAEVINQKLTVPDITKSSISGSVDNVHSEQKILTSSERHTPEIAKKLGPRQKSMPLQIETQVMRILPKHLRKRIQSAEGQKANRSFSVFEKKFKERNDRKPAS